MRWMQMILVILVLGGCGSITYLPESDEIRFLKAGETYTAERPMVVLEKGTFLELYEAAAIELMPDSD